MDFYKVSQLHIFISRLAAAVSGRRKKTSRFAQRISADERSQINSVFTPQLLPVKAVLTLKAFNVKQWQTDFFSSSLVFAVAVV